MAGNGFKWLKIASSAAHLLSKKKTVTTAQYLSRNGANASALQPNSPTAQQKEISYNFSAP